MRASHPDFARWDRRIRWYLAVPFLLAVVSPLVVALTIEDVSLRVFVGFVSWGSAGVIALIISLVQRRGRLRFRELWTEEHSALATR